MGPIFHPHYAQKHVFEQYLAQSLSRSLSYTILLSHPSHMFFLTSIEFDEEWKLFYEYKLISFAIFSLSVVPTWVKPLKDVSLINGKPLKLEVVVNGIPKPTVQWLKDGNVLDEKEYTFDSKDKTHSISIGESSIHHAGTYTAVAENDAGKAESIAQVEIQTKPQVSKPDDIKIISGSEFMVPVKIDGKPDPKIKWMKDKVDLPASLGITIEKKENIYTMYLKESTINLNGNYSITATNSAGSDTTHFRVTVLGKDCISTWQNELFAVDHSHCGDICTTGSSSSIGKKY